MSPKQKKTTSNLDPATPNAALSGVAYGRDSSISLLGKAKKNAPRTFNKKQIKAMFHAIAAAPLGPVGIAVSQHHQGSSILPSGVTVAFSSTGGQFAISDLRDSLYHFDTQSRECLSRMKLEGAILSLAYSSNGQQIAIGTKEGRIYLWDLQLEEPSAILEGHEDYVRCIAYSPCGQWIASGSDDKTVGIWYRRLSDEVESWSRVHSICAFFGWVGNVAWNPVVPMELVTGCVDGSVQ
ncbi:hypothetical protein BGW39_008581, partial [Mortierella sp. 14UC]